MLSLNIEDAQADLRQLITDLTPGEQLTITDNGQPVATITKSGVKRWPAKAGSAKNTDHWMAPDFDAPLDDFKDYME